MNLLFVCTHNRCRSILAEAITSQHAQGKLRAYSAGSAPAGEVHPLTIQYLKQCNYKTEGLISQSWKDFENAAIDLVITVCDSAAQESCPLWIGKTMKTHWSISDPSKINGPEGETERTFLNTIKNIEDRVIQLIDLLSCNLDKDDLILGLEKIAKNNT